MKKIVLTFKQGCFLSQIEKGVHDQQIVMEESFCPKLKLMKIISELNYIVHISLQY